MPSDRCGARQARQPPVGMLSVVRAVSTPTRASPDHYVAADASALHLELDHLDVDGGLFLADADA